MSRTVIALSLLILWPVVLGADTLVLRNGTRIEGELVAVRGSIIEFEERRGFGRGRRVEVDRFEVARIEFDEPRPSPEFPGTGRPSGMRERQVMVAANVAWIDTGIDVRQGQTIYFEADGNVRWGRDRRDGPAGEDNSPMNPNRPLPNRPAAALIGRIGMQSQDAFFIGNDQGPLRARASGRLYLGINDDFIQDNTGSFRVVVYY